jgi:hypothetical protein
MSNPNFEGLVPKHPGYGSELEHLPYQYSPYGEPIALRNSFSFAVERTIFPSALNQPSSEHLREWRANGSRVYLDGAITDRPGSPYIDFTDSGRHVLPVEIASPEMSDPGILAQWRVEAARRLIDTTHGIFSRAVKNGVMGEDEEIHLRLTTADQSHRKIKMPMVGVHDSYLLPPDNALVNKSSLPHIIPLSLIARAAVAGAGDVAPGGQFYPGQRYYHTDRTKGSRTEATTIYSCRVGKTGRQQRRIDDTDQPLHPSPRLEVRNGCYNLDSEWSIAIPQLTLHAANHLEAARFAERSVFNRREWEEDSIPTSMRDELFIALDDDGNVIPGESRGVINMANFLAGSVSLALELHRHKQPQDINHDLRLTGEKIIDACERVEKGLRDGDLTNISDIEWVRRLVALKGLSPDDRQVASSSYDLVRITPDGIELGQGVQPLTGVSSTELTEQPPDDTRASLRVRAIRRLEKTGAEIDEIDWHELKVYDAHGKETVALGGFYPDTAESSEAA